MVMEEDWCPSGCVSTSGDIFPVGNDIHRMFPGRVSMVSSRWLSPSVVSCFSCSSCLCLGSWSTMMGAGSSFRNREGSDRCGTWWGTIGSATTMKNTVASPSGGGGKERIKSCSIVNIDNGWEFGTFPAGHVGVMFSSDWFGSGISIWNNN